MGPRPERGTVTLASQHPARSLLVRRLSLERFKARSHHLAGRLAATLVL
jgi:hypothetical protein